VVGWLGISVGVERIIFLAGLDEFDSEEVKDAARYFG
jgi:hypothetical protein